MTAVIFVQHFSFLIRSEVYYRFREIFAKMKLSEIRNTFNANLIYRID